MINSVLIFKKNDKKLGFFCYTRDAQSTLIDAGGFVDEDMYFGLVHMLQLISSQYVVNDSILWFTVVFE